MLRHLDGVETLLCSNLEFSHSSSNLVQLLVYEEVVGLGEVPLAGVALHDRLRASRKS